jgi:NADH dehydrogenase
MVVWTAGVTGESFEFPDGELKMGPGRRFIVDEFNRAEGHDDIFVLGDVSLHTDDMYPRGCPQLAQVAIQQARTLAHNLNSGKWDHPFVYNDKGSMATIGRNKAVADLKHMHLTGFLAWFTWMFIHLISILGMRNKLVVLTNWVWAYFSYPTSLRLLIHPGRYPLRARWGEK